MKMLTDERRRKAQLRPWTREWDDHTWRIEFESPIKPEDIVPLEICTHIDPKTGDQTWEPLERWGRNNIP